jgi:hypothetical protein
METTMNGGGEQVPGSVLGGRPLLRPGLLIGGGATTLVGAVLLVEELTDLLRGAADLDETFGALFAIAVGLTLLAGGALLRDGGEQGARRLGAGFTLATGGIAIGGGALAAVLAVAVDLAGSGVVVIAGAVTLGVVLVGGLLAAAVDRNWRLAAGLAIVTVGAGVALIAGLVATVASGGDLPVWVGMLDD